MTAITNVVVALMIVSGGEEPVMAVPCAKHESGYPMIMAWDEPETLYRKTSKTNWVYATNIQVELLKGVCNERGCFGTTFVEPADLIGSKVHSVYFDVKKPLKCELHADGKKKERGE